MQQVYWHNWQCGLAERAVGTFKFFPCDVSEPPPAPINQPANFLAKKYVIVVLELISKIYLKSAPGFAPGFCKNGYKPVSKNGI